MNPTTALMILDIVVALRALAARLPQHKAEMELLANQIEVFVREDREPTIPELRENKLQYIATSEALERQAAQPVGAFPGSGGRGA